MYMYLVFLPLLSSFSFSLPIYIYIHICLLYIYIFCFISFARSHTLTKLLLTFGGDPLRSFFSLPFPKYICIQSEGFSLRFLFVSRCVFRKGEVRRMSGPPISLRVAVSLHAANRRRGNAIIPEIKLEKKY